jgi:hypothetical protein
MRSPTSDYKICVATFQPSQRDASIAPYRPTSSPAIKSAGMADIYRVLPERG